MRHCCEAMQDHLTRQCDDHADSFDCPDALVHYTDRFDEYGLIIHDGGTSVSLISHCPWCGTSLPESKRDRWFDELEALGFDDPTAQDIPVEYTTGRWHRRQGLA